MVSLTHFLLHYDNGRYEKGLLAYIENGNFNESVGDIETINKQWLEYIRNLKGLSQVK